jgi:hypothetical protein
MDSYRSPTGRTREQLKVAFESVQDQENWKNPIHKVLPISQVDIPLISEAVAFYTGCHPTFNCPARDEAGRFSYDNILIVADGYYKAVGA